jgi:hypothetical protein
MNFDLILQAYETCNVIIKKCVTWRGDKVEEDNAASRGHTVLLQSLFVVRGQLLAKNPPLAVRRDLKLMVHLGPELAHGHAGAHTQRDRTLVRNFVLHIHVHPKNAIVRKTL